LNWFTVNAGSLIVADRTELRQWNDGETKYFAETLNLFFEPAAPLKPYVHEKIGPFALRLVLANDPAVGHWEVSDKSSGSSIRDVSNAVTRRLSEIGLTYDGYFDDGVATVTSAAKKADTRPKEVTCFTLTPVPQTCHLNPGVTGVFGLGVYSSERTGLTSCFSPGMGTTVYANPVFETADGRWLSWTPQNASISAMVVKLPVPKNAKGSVDVTAYLGKVVEQDGKRICAIAHAAE
jgi:hypothetical protein